MPAPNYTIFEYRNLSEPISQEKGHALERNTQHYKGRQGVINLFGLHIAVVADDTVLPDMSGENLNNYGATTTRQASWHVSVDTDTICVSLRDAYTAWVQGVPGFDFNSNGLGAEIATLQTDWRKIPAWRQYRFLRHLAAWYAPRVMKYRNVIKLERNRNTVQSNVANRRPAGFAYHGDLDPANRTDPGLISGRVDTFPIDLFFSLLYDEINIRLGYHGNVYKDTRFAYKPYTYGQRDMEIFCWGEDVLQWQRNLNAVGFKTSTDKSFGPGCEAQTRAFQKKFGLVEDGIAGPGTQKKMVEALKMVSTPVPPPVDVPPTDYNNTTIPIKRIGGTNRFDANINVVKQIGQGGNRKVYVVAFEDFSPDAISAAAAGDGVVVGARQNAIPAVSVSWIKSYNPTSVMIVGGSTTLSDTVLRQVQTEFLKK